MMTTKTIAISVSELIEIQIEAPEYDVTTGRQITRCKYLRPVALPEAVLTAVRQQSAGRYQEALLSHQETWSGASLRGKAADWGGMYALSRASLFRRIRAVALRLGWSAEIALVSRPGESGPRRRELVLRPITETTAAHVW